MSGTAIQEPIFDLDTMREISPNWIDPMQPLRIPANPLHVKAHRLQVLLAKLDRQAEEKPSAFNSSNYMGILDEYIKCVEQIKEGKTASEVLDEGGLDNYSTRSKTPPMGPGNAAGVDIGVSADNPLAG